MSSKEEEYSLYDAVIKTIKAGGLMLAGVLIYEIYTNAGALEDIVDDPWNFFVHDLFSIGVKPCETPKWYSNFSGLGYIMNKLHEHDCKEQREEDERKKAAAKKLEDAQRNLDNTAAQYYEQEDDLDISSELYWFPLETPPEIAQTGAITIAEYKRYQKTGNIVNLIRAFKLRVFMTPTEVIVISKVYPTRLNEIVTAAKIENNKGPAFWDMVTRMYKPGEYMLMDLFLR